jgi:uncharacterized membrane protein YdfJ with MMPL/SSD domain
MHDMEALLQRLALLARAEALAMRIHARHAARTVAFSSAALAAAMFAFGLLNLWAFNLLAAAFGQTAASLVLAAVDAVLALILLMLARRRVPSPEEKMVDELRALALAELANDAARLKAQVHQLQHQVTRCSSVSRASARSCRWRRACSIARRMYDSGRGSVPGTPHSTCRHRMRSLTT